MAEGYGIDRRDVMHNDFVIVGPKSDPAGVKGGKDATVALTRIAASKAPSPAAATTAAPTDGARLWKGAGVDVKATGPTGTASSGRAWGRR